MELQKSHLHEFFALGIIGLLFFAGLMTPYPAPSGSVALAGAAHNVSGFAWSDTIGWISFNCTDTSSCGTADYGVAIDEQGGIMSGYAWSPHIGWISFNESELSGCPSGQCRAKLSGNALQGWAKALAANQAENGGWDGFISLKGSQYGVTRAENALGGFAWGSDVLGWIDFSGGAYSGVSVGYGPVSALLQASPTQVAQGGSATLSWTSTNATSCSGTGFATGGTTNGSTSVSPSVKTTYTLTCENPLTANSDQETILVYDVECSDGIDNDADTKTDYPADTGCTSASGDNENSATLVNASISASRTSVLTGNTVVITWNASSVSSCTVSGTNGNSWNGTSGVETSSPITETTTYTLACLDLEDVPAPAESVTINITPVFEEF